MRTDEVSIDQEYPARRQFLRTAGTLGAVAASFVGATFGTLRQASADQIDDELFADKVAGEAGPDFQIIALVDSFMERALREQEDLTIGGDLEALRERFEEAAAIYALVQQRLTDLDFTLQIEDKYRRVDPTVPFVAFDDFLAAENTALMALAPVDVTKKTLAKLLSVVGLADIAIPVAQLLSEEGLFDALAKAITNPPRGKRFEAIGKVLGKILDFMLSKNFFNKLATKLGAKAAARASLKLASRTVPFVGWAILIASVIWALAAELI